MKKTNFLILSLLTSFFLGQVAFSQTVELWGTAFNGGAHKQGTVYKLNSDGTGFAKIHDFEDTPENGSKPVGQLVQIGCKLYGVTERGGSGEAFFDGKSTGVLYSIDLAENGNNDFTVEYEFFNNSTEVEFAQSMPDLFWKEGIQEFPTRDIVAYNGLIYGVDRGVNQIFSYDPSTPGGTYTDLYQFTFNAEDDIQIDDQNWPNQIVLKDGVIYGTTYFGGLGNLGTVWKYDINSGLYEVLGDLADANGGRQPYGKVLVANNGDIYVNCQFHTTNPTWGVIERLLPDGEWEQVIEFQGGLLDEAGGFCAGSLQEIPAAGKIFGATRWTNPGGGALFSINTTTGDLAIEYTFDAAIAFDLASGLFTSTNFNMYAATHGVISAEGDTIAGQVISLPLGGTQLEALHYFDPTGIQGRNSIHGILNQKDPTLDYSDPEVCTITSVNNVSETFPLSVFPNPTNGNVNLEIGVAFKELNVTVSNLVGKAILSTNQTSFDLTNVPVGIYFLTIEVDGKTAVEKLIVE